MSIGNYMTVGKANSRAKSKLVTPIPKLMINMGTPQEF